VTGCISRSRRAAKAAQVQGAANSFELVAREWIDQQYSMIMGFWAGTMRAQCSLKAVCIVGNTRPFEKMYHGERVESVQVVQTAAENTEYVNDAISKAVNAVLVDPELSNCLAGPAL
jgi:predicted esterase YcpF (UPF0227 family)